MGANIYFEAVVHITKNNFFHQRIIEVVNWLDLNDQNYQINGTLLDENYRGKFLFNMTYFVPFVTDRQSMFYLSNRFLKYNIYGVCVPKFQLSCIIGITTRMGTLLCYYLCLVLSCLPIWLVSPFFPIPDFYAHFPDFYAKLSCY